MPGQTPSCDHCTLRVVSEQPISAFTRCKTRICVRSHGNKSANNPGQITSVGRPGYGQWPSGKQRYNTTLERDGTPHRSGSDRCSVSNGGNGANSNALARCIRADLMSCSVAWKMNWRVYSPADPKVHYSIDGKALGIGGFLSRAETCPSVSRVSSPPGTGLLPTVAPHRSSPPAPLCADVYLSHRAARSSV